MQSACPRPRGWLRWPSNARQCLVNSRDGLVRRTVGDVDDVGDVGGDCGKQKGMAEQAAAAATAKKKRRFEDLCLSH